MEHKVSEDGRPGRDDGFIKTKHRGRIDALEQWPSIRQRWVGAYRSRKIIDGFSAMREVGPNDEWCAEAYLTTNYTTVGPHMFMEAANDTF